MSELMVRRTRMMGGLSALMLVLSALTSQAAEPKPTIAWSVTNLSIKGKPGETIKLQVKADVPKGWHTYSTKTYGDDGPFPTSIKVTPDTLLKLDGAITATNLKSEKSDAWNFEIETVDGSATFTVPVKIDANAKPGDQDAMVVVKAQQCNEKTCLPPKEAKISFKLTVVDKAEEPKKENVPLLLGTDSGGSGSQNARQVFEDAKKSLFTFLLLAMGAGIAALFTPCVFPMIPITVSFFTKRMHSTRLRAVMDASVFSMGMVGTFTGLALPLVLMFGATSISQLVANRYFNLAFTLLMVLFALNLFGVFEIQIPSFILNRLNKSSQKGDGFISVFLMGALFSLTSFTCTGAFVGQIFVSAANGDWRWPLIGMLAFSTAFALPFFFLALFPAVIKSLPKSGGWLNSVKVVLGFVEVAFALKYLSGADAGFRWGFFNREVCLSIWVAISALTTAYLLGWFQMTHDTPVERVGGVRVLFASSFLAAGVFIATGLSGRNLGPLDSLIAPSESDVSASAVATAPAPNGVNCEPAKPKELVWLKDWDEARKESAKSGKPLFVDFTGITCVNCNRMERSVFPKPEIASLLSNYVLVRLYTDKQNPDEERIRSEKNMDLQQSRFNSVALPLYAIITPDDKDVGQFEGMADKTEDFVAFLNSGVKTADKPVASR
jgi:thiol:disulfide interchange protein